LSGPQRKAGADQARDPPAPRASRFVQQVVRGQIFPATMALPDVVGEDLAEVAARLAQWAQPWYSFTLSRVISLDGISIVVCSGFLPFIISSPICTASLPIVYGS